MLQPIRSQAEWQQLLQWAGEDARAAFADYEFVLQTAFDSEFVVIVQLQASVDASLRLLSVERQSESVQLRVDQYRVGEEDTPATRYLFVRVPDTEEPLGLVEAKIDPNFRRIELFYHAQPCVCGHTETDE